MASFVTNKAKMEMLKEDVDTVVLRLLLVDTPPASEAAAQDLNTVSQIVADELAGTGYARQTVNTQTVTEDDSGNRAVIDAVDPATYSAIDAGLIAGAWVYRRVGGGDVDANDLLWFFLDCTDLTTNGGDVTLSYHATDGLATVT